MRGKKAPKRDIRPDEVYGSVTVAKLINYIMIDGKKNAARDIVYGAMEELGEKTGVPAVKALEKGLRNVKPEIEVRSRRVGGSNYQVPTPVLEGRQMALAFRWIIAAARGARKNQPMSKVLGRELIDAYNSEGMAMRKKEEVQRMAEANRAFAHFAW